MSKASDGAKAGIGLGSAIAVAISWSLHKSVVWATIHGVLSWVYVLYYVFTRPGGIFA
ncbi:MULTISPECIES: hypothetical protein [Novosphingobium]|uniref:hypothetical protein n=1 Tax=Novosphingobium TaxID=165696 RepID=UPI001CD69978|nr:hypothetical protein [Novosphingobium percolationis]MCH7628351.1 hypothetical protein [Pseudomonadota bacterium]